MIRSTILIACAIALAAFFIVLEGGEEPKKPAAEKAGENQAAPAAPEKENAAEKPQEHPAPEMKPQADIPKPPTAEELAKAVEDAYHKFLAMPAPPADAKEEKERGFAGISLGLVPKENLEKLDLKENEAGIFITKCLVGTPACASGILDNDIIVSVDGAPISAGGDVLVNFSDLMKDKKPGDVVKFAIRRGDKRLDIEVKLGRRPRIDAVPPAHPELEMRAPSFALQALQNCGLIDNANLALADNAKQALVVHDQGALVEDKYDPYRLSEVIYVLSNPAALAPRAQRIASDFDDCFSGDFPDFARLVAKAAEKLDLKAAKLPPAAKWESPLFDLSKAAGKFQTARNVALAAITDNEAALIEGAMPRWLGENEDTGIKANAAVIVLQIGMRIDRAALLAAAAQFLNELTPENIKALRADAEKKYADSGEKRLVLESAVGEIVLCGNGDDAHTEDAAVIIDLGGNDIYRNHAGVSGWKRPISIVIDYAGDDVYTTSGQAAQGAGVLGLGVLLDLGGDDTYRAARGCQGFGAMGVGILFDNSGDDHYAANDCAQGVGLIGIGMLLEGEGRDSYDIQIGGQALGLPGGVGLIIEKSGNDYYTAGGKYPDHRDPTRSCCTLAQGFGYGTRPWDMPVGASGGIGVLLDRAGNDVYVADYFGQGASYWFALGILVDVAGGDTYHAGRYCQGHGCHLSAGALIDHSGNDRYTAYTGVAQGCAHDYSAAVLLDAAGDDVYESAWLATGAANGGGGAFLLDLAGNDRYTSTSGMSSIGHGQPEGGTGREHSLGALIDADGNDTYSAAARKIENGSYSISGNVGVTVDITGGKLPSPPPEEHKFDGK